MLILRDEIIDCLGGFDAGEFLVETLKGNREAVVIEADELEKGGVEVAEVDGISGCEVAHVIGLAVGGAGFDPCASHPDGEGVRVVVASEEGHFCAVAVLLHGSAAEFAAPDDEGVIHHASLFEIGEKGGDRFVDRLTFSDESFVEGFIFSGSV